MKGEVYMNPNMPYDSNALKNMVSRVKTYCSHIIPLVFDNTLSYYETLCAFCGKLNELCDAVNAQNLTIAEYAHMVEVEISKFEEYMQGELTTLKDDMEDVKGDITAILNELSNDIRPALAQLEESVNTLQSDMEEKIGWNDMVYSVLENNDHPVTSGAVYDAIQESGGGGGFVPDATRTSKGIVQIGDNINVSAGEISVPKATLNNFGVVYPGVGVSIPQNQAGVINLNTATENTIGGVKVGDNLDVENDGTISVPVATHTSKGVVTTDSQNSGLDFEYSALGDTGSLKVNTENPLYINTQTNKVGIKLGNTMAINSSGQLESDIPVATYTSFGKVTTDNLTSGLALTSGVLSVNKGDTLSIDQNNKLDVKTMTASQKGVSAPLLNGAITVNNSGEIDVRNATTSLKGAVTLGSTFGTQQTDTVPTCADVYNNFAPKATENFAVRADAPDANGDSQLYKIDAQGVRTNLTPVVQGGGSVTVPDATTTSKGIVQIGNNISVSNGEISVPVGSNSQMGVVTAGTNTSIVNGEVRVADASTSNKGVVQTSNTIDGNSTYNTVPTSRGIYEALTGNTDSVLYVNQLDGTLNVNGASTTQKGVVKIGDNIDIGTDATISVPKATSSSLGVVQAGSRLSVDSNGVLNVPMADNNDHYGVVKVPSSSNLICNSVGELDVFTGTTTNKGILQVGSGIDVNNGVISVPTATDTTAGSIVYDNRHLETTTAGKLNVKTTNSVLGGNSYDIPIASAIVGYNSSLMTSSVTSGDTLHVPTSDAVYQAVQSAGVAYYENDSPSITSTLYQGFTTNPNSATIINAYRGYKVTLQGGSAQSQTELIVMLETPWLVNKVLINPYVAFRTSSSYSAYCSFCKAYILSDGNTYFRFYSTTNFSASYALELYFDVI